MNWNPNADSGQEVARPDFDRHARKGVPEVIIAEHKAVEQSLSIARHFLERNGRAILSRVSPELEARLRTEFEGQAQLEWVPLARMAVLRRPGTSPPQTGGRVGVLTAGTSDIPVAEEAAVTAEIFGNRIEKVFDVGVAGIHRLYDRLDILRGAKVLVVIAGMEGALPSVVGGLVDKPVIAVPTSIGYGAAFQGIAALLGMLTSCTSGIGVVNIDNGFGAAYLASMINKL